MLHEGFYTVKEQTGYSPAPVDSPRKYNSNNPQNRGKQKPRNHAIMECGHPSFGLAKLAAIASSPHSLPGVEPVPPPPVSTTETYPMWAAIERRDAWGRDWIMASPNGHQLRVSRHPGDFPARRLLEASRVYVPAPSLARAQPDVVPQMPIAKPPAVPVLRRQCPWLQFGWLGVDYGCRSGREGKRRRHYVLARPAIASFYRTTGWPLLEQQRHQLHAEQHCQVRP